MGQEVVKREFIHSEDNRFLRQFNDGTGWGEWKVESVPAILEKVTVEFGFIERFKAALAGKKPRAVTDKCYCKEDYECLPCYYRKRLKPNEKYLLRIPKEPEMKLIQVGGHTINDALNPKSVVIDTGAHEGMFLKAISEKYGCNVYGYEPSKELFAKLKKVCDGVRGRFCFNMAVTMQPGKATFTDYGNAGHSGSMLERTGKMYKAGDSYEVETVSLANAIEQHRTIDLLKINCEGGEVSMLQWTQPSYLRQCKQIKVSYHVGAHKGFNPPFTEGDVKECNDRMGKLGFKVVRTGDKNPDYSYLRR